MNGVGIVVLGIGGALVLRILLWKFGWGMGSSTSTNPTADPFLAKSNTLRSIGLKMVGGTLVAMSVLGIAVLMMSTSDKPGPALTASQLVGFSLFAGVTGCLLGLCLAVKDVVRDRLSEERRVTWILRAYFASGAASLVLWSVTIFAAGIGGIVFYYSILNPEVGPAG